MVGLQQVRHRTGTATGTTINMVHHQFHQHQLLIQIATNTMVLNVWFAHIDTISELTVIALK
jgi:hypothetical protein